MGLLLSAAIGFGTALFFAIILFWLDRYEKEPIFLLGGVFLWGAIIAAGSAFLINTVLGVGVAIFTGSSFATDLATGSFIAPIVEETLKGLAVLVVFIVFHNEFDSVLDGIIYAGVAALGFAATENTYYIYTYGFQESGLAGVLSLTFVRVILVGWQHPFYTSFIGIGLAIARMNRSWWVRILGPLAGWGAAMFTHGFHNTVASLLNGMAGLVIGAIFDWSGWLLMLGVILWAAWSEGRSLQKYLAAEVQSGCISPALYHTASSAWRQMGARTVSIFNGRYRKTARFYQVCGEYAHKQKQLEKLGDEGGNAAILQKLRTEMAALAPYAQV